MVKKPDDIVPVCSMRLDMPVDLRNQLFDICRNKMGLSVTAVVKTLVADFCKLNGGDSEIKYEA